MWSDGRPEMRFVSSCTQRRELSGVRWRWMDAPGVSALAHGIAHRQVEIKARQGNVVGNGAVWG